MSDYQNFVHAQIHVWDVLPLFTSPVITSLDGQLESCNFGSMFQSHQFEIVSMAMTLADNRGYQYVFAWFHS